MNEAARQLYDERIRRNAARKTFETRLAQVRADLAARSIGGRVVDAIGSEAKSLLDESLEIANANRGVIAGTFAALAMWFLRHPIIDAFGTMARNHQETDDVECGQDAANPDIDKELSNV